MIGSVASAHLPIPNKSHHVVRNEQVFNKQIQNKVLSVVATLMDLEIDEKIPKPLVIPISTIDPGYVSRLFGLPVDTRTQLVNIYDPSRNIIILADNAKLHNLAHEYVHYFQYMYKNLTPEYDYQDSLEREAVKIQYKAMKYLNNISSI
ncbi:MAG: hypothetical protein WC284_03725 [Candidimonas sp.]